jgi:hypothetical protein
MDNKKAWGNLQAFFMKYMDIGKLHLPENFLAFSAIVQEYSSNLS